MRRNRIASKPRLPCRRAAWGRGGSVAVVVATATAGLTYGGVASGTPAITTIYIDNIGAHTITPFNGATDVASTPIALGAVVPDQIAAAPNGKTLYVLTAGNDETGGPGAIVPIATSTGSLGSTYGAGSNPNFVAIAPNGATAYVLDEIDAATTPATTPATVTPINLVTHGEGKPIKVGTFPEAMAVAPNGKLLYVVDTPPSDNGVPIAITPVNLVTGAPGAAIALPHGPAPFDVSGIAFAPNSAAAYVLTSGGVRTINTVTGKVGRLIGLGAAYPTAVAVTPNGADVAIVGVPLAGLEQRSGYGNNVTFALVNATTGAVGKVATLGDEPGGQVWQIAMSPDGSTAYVLELASAGRDSELYTINLATGVASKPFSVGKDATAMAVVAGSPPSGPAPSTSAKRLPISPPVVTQLIAAFAGAKHLRVGEVELEPADALYAYDSTTKTYWFEANFSPAKGDSLSVEVSMQDAGGFGIFSKGITGPWHYRGASLPITCAEEELVPAAVLSLWSVPLKSSACPT